METKLVNYAFISYKRIDADEEWAKTLNKWLNRWYIPTEIAYDERLNNNKRISPVIRDKDNFPPGNGLNETIKKYLRESRTLIIILSKAMLEDQINLRSMGGHAYVFEEIEYFKTLERPKHSIIPVYIDSEIQNPTDLLPPMLNDIDPKLIVNVNEYLPQKSERLWAKRITAVVAAGIFQKDQQLFFDYHRKAVRKSRIKFTLILLSIFFVLIGAPLFLLFNKQRIRTRIEESYGLIAQSRQARNLHDVQAALIFALEAYEKSPDLDAAVSNLRQQAIINEQEPRTFLTNTYVEITSGSKEILACNYDNGIIRLLHSYDLSEITRINSMPIRKMALSPDSRKIGMLAIDSIRIYDVSLQRFIYSKSLNGFMMFAPYHRVYFDSKSKFFFICGVGNSIIRVNVETKQTDTIYVDLKSIYHGNNIKFYEDNLYFGIEYSTFLKLYMLDCEKFELTPVCIIPNNTDNWTIHNQTHQIAYEINDSIYRVNSHSKIFCGIGKIVSFEQNGNRLLWYNDIGV